MNRHRLLKVGLLLLPVLLLDCRAWACDVPVFRYALERWPADPYLVIVFHRGELTGEQNALLKKFRELEDRDSSVAVATVPVDGNMPAELKTLWEPRKASALPLLVLCCPERHEVKEPVWAGPLTQEAVRAILDSPVRREVARRLLKADEDAAVWLLLTTGDRRKDQAAWTCLEENLRKAEAAIATADEGRIPAAPDQDDTQPGAQSDKDGAQPGADPDEEYARPAARFSCLAVDRNDPAEAILLATFARMSPEVPDANQPIAFPVFGRGRALTLLAGDKINAENIADVCEFLAGDCSCTIKQANPGFDLFIPVDWDGLLTGRLVVDKELPPLQGPASLVLHESADPVGAGAASVAGDAAPHLVRNLLYLAAGGAVLLVGSTWVLLRRRKATG